MSKESLAGDYCPGCGGTFAFIEFHAPHCKRSLLTSPKPLTGVAAGIVNTLAELGSKLPGMTPEKARQAAEATVRSAGVGLLLNHGAVPDQPKKQRKGAKVKRTSAKGGGKRG